MPVPLPTLLVSCERLLKSRFICACVAYAYEWAPVIEYVRMNTVHVRAQELGKMSLTLNNVFTACEFYLTIS